MNLNNTTVTLSNTEIIDMWSQCTIDNLPKYSDWQERKSNKIWNRVSIGRDETLPISKLDGYDKLEIDKIHRLEAFGKRYIFYKSKYGQSAIIDLDDPIRHGYDMGYMKYLNVMWEMIGSENRCGNEIFPYPNNLAVVSIYEKIEKENYLSHIPENIIDELIYLLYFKPDGEYIIEMDEGKFICIIIDRILEMVNIIK